MNTLNEFRIARAKKNTPLQGGAFDMGKNGFEWEANNHYSYTAEGETIHLIYSFKRVGYTGLYLGLVLFFPRTTPAEEIRNDLHLMLTDKTGSIPFMGEPVAPGEDDFGDYGL